MSTFVKTLSGYSGCHIHLYNDGGKLFVRKLSGSKEYNKRLERQIVKQAAFKHPTLRAPQVYKTGYINGCFYADMEYIEGETVASLVRNGKYDIARKAIYSVLTLFVPTNTVLTNANDVIGKIESMHDALKCFDETEWCQKTLSVLETHTWETHPSACHGDLTLENMLVKNGNVYLIDFLDTFHDCLEADMAKMLQDLCCMWSFRHETLSTDGILFLQECAHHVKMLYRKITNSDEKQLQAMLQLTLLRIYPYLKDKKTKLFLDTELQVLL